MGLLGLFRKPYTLIYRNQFTKKTGGFRKVVKATRSSAGVVAVESKGITIYNLSEGWHHWLLSNKERQILGMTGPRWENRPR